MPRFSVIMAAYNRGAHIVPSIQSVLRQDLQDFELLIVGDGCTDSTADAVRPFLSPRVKWMNLTERGGSQSFANNAGIAEAAGDRIAYIGHDDIWARDHLRRLEKAFAESDADFAVSGAILHMPPDTGGDLVTGMFEDDRAKFEHFFPPSSFAHKASVIGKIEPWAGPYDIRAPVDCDFLLRAASAGCRFVSTRAVTVHKFAASHRYLFYLHQESFEQHDVLKRMDEPDYDQFVAVLVAGAKAGGGFMSSLYADFSKHEIGDIARESAARKASTRPAVIELKGSAIVPQDDKPRSKDWRPLRSRHLGFRWSARNPRPKILIPYTSAAPVRIGMRFRHRRKSVLNAIRWQTANGDVIVPEIRLRFAWLGWEAHASAVLRLSPTDPIALTLLLPPEAIDHRRGRGVAMAEMTLDEEAADRVR
jgi:glycosyltransferase involved in cell wall biosynthesis